jgi:predicted transcriptional regulator
MRKSAEALVKHQEAVERADAALQLAMIARAEAIKRKDAAMEASRAAEDSIPAAQLAFVRAGKILDEITKKKEAGRGTVFFLNADLNESRKYLPKSKFVVAQKSAEEAMRKSLSSF